MKYALLEKHEYLIEGDCKRKEKVILLMDVSDIGSLSNLKDVSHG